MVADERTKDLLVWLKANLYVSSRGAWVFTATDQRTELQLRQSETGGAFCVSSQRKDVRRSTLSFKMFSVLDVI